MSGFEWLVTAYHLRASPFIKNRRGASHLLAFPIGEGGPRQRRSGAFINRRFEILLPARFHTAGALSAPSGHLPPEGKAGDTRIPSSNMAAKPPPEPFEPFEPSEPVEPRSLKAGMSGFEWLVTAYHLRASPLYKKSTRSVAPLSLPHRGRGTASAALGCFRKSST